MSLPAVDLDEPIDEIVYAMAPAQWVVDRALAINLRNDQQGVTELRRLEVLKIRRYCPHPAKFHSGFAELHNCEACGELWAA